MKKIKVLQVVGSLRVGGAETVALNYYKYINKDEFEFDYLVYGDQKEPLEEEIYKLKGRVLRVRSPKQGIINFLKDIKDILNNNGPYDVIHSHPLFNSGWIMKIAYQFKIPIRISHAHSARYNVNNNILKEIYIVLMRRFINKYSTHILACSNDAGNYLYGERQFKLRGKLIRNGIEVEKYIFSNIVRNNIREELKLNNKLTIGHIGRFCDVKNQEFIIKIFAELVKIRKDVQLVLVGDGETKKNIEEQVNRLSLQEQVMFLGTRQDIHRILHGLDILIFPSKYEGLGIVVIEAQCSGLKCIISENVPKEVDITNLITRIPLDEGVDKWVTEIMQCSKVEDRPKLKDIIIESGYEIEHIVKEISNIYRKE